MVAKITTPARLLAALNYNENKVKSGKAFCLHAKGFLREPENLSFQQKADGFERLNTRNERAKTKTLHISLNFDPSEKLKQDKLVAIAEAYLKGIGFADQPALIYQHTDAGHPHIHIVTTTIREDGSRINTHNIGRNQSETTRKLLEEQFGLIKATGKRNTENSNLPTIPLSYGKTESKKYIQQVVSQVCNSYLFSSLPEFNAILSLYHVIADKGTEQSLIFQHGGLTYCMLDENGRKTGVPIKASLIAGNPGLKRLKNVFDENRAGKEPLKKILREALDKAIQQRPASLEVLSLTLQKQNIKTVLRKTADQRIYGITFIDQANRVVFNGSDIGKAYSAAHLAATLRSQNNSTNAPAKTSIQQDLSLGIDQQLLITTLLQPEQEFNPTPGLLKKKRKRNNKRLKP